MLQMNTWRAPFDDPKVRQAVQYAVDKEAVITSSGGPAFNEVSTAYMPAALFGGKQPDTLKIPATGDPDRGQAAAEGGREAERLQAPR